MGAITATIPQDELDTEEVGMLGNRPIDIARDWINDIGKPPQAERQIAPYSSNTINVSTLHSLLCLFVSKQFTTSFAAASSAYDPFTPTSRRSTPNESSSMDFGSHHNSVSHRAELSLPSSAMGKSMFGPVKPESEHTTSSNSLPDIPINREQLGFEYEHMMEMSMAHRRSTGSLTPSNSFGMCSYSADASMGPASFIMAPTQSHPCL
ncbi:hypothetical protein AU210_015733 [Fusarium oxysporum f. sp. radicis-cucumerinum]|uniref:Uncharacterized protein n=1 Tax=Fusarium oxysporum f. sp. radicis-cucumerinum TaxID=327505 RepID=A0A2H3FUT9_FUSOX|nr:hypothetical protein AU210_015733 [Fusarium oxysporum f. sp. radicis-cucumerinum]